MNAFDAIALVAEEKIREAIKEGAFDNLPGAGKPLVLEDDSHIPPEFRMAYKILKNAGYCEGHRRESFAESLDSAPEEKQAYQSGLRFALLMRKIRRTKSVFPAHSGVAHIFGNPLPDPVEDSSYREKLLQKMPRRISS